MDRFSAQAWQMLLTPAVRDLAKEPEKLRDRYGRDSVGQSALLARRLVEAGTRFVTTAGFHANSWDTHGASDQGHRDRLAPPLDRTLSVLLEDLEERGRLDSTVVLAMGEFGRTPELKSGSRPRSLAKLLVSRARRRRHSRRPRSGSQ